MSLQLPIPFTSPSNADLSIQYVQLNHGAKFTIVYCYGAGGRSRDLTLYQDYVVAHPDLSILCVDRWTQGPKAARTGPELMSELSAITIELLDSLKIDKFSIAAHSAGAYQTLNLASQCPSRVQHVFPLCTHIPYPYTNSKLMSSMCTMPEFLFYGLTKLDQKLGDTEIEKIWLRLAGSKKTERDEHGKFVDSKKLKEILGAYKPDEKQASLQKERLDLDYKLGYCRIPGIQVETLVATYTKCTASVLWFTADADVFFGPASVERIAKDMKSAIIETILVPEASHGDVFMRIEVWDKMYERVSRD